MTKLPSAFGQQLNKIRLERNLSLAQLSIKSHVPVCTISSWIYHSANPNLQNLILVADSLNISLDELCGRKFPKEEQV